MIDSQLVAWAAGLFDGEGCIRIQKDHWGNYILQLTLKMTHEPTIDRLGKLFPNGRKYRDKGRKNRKDCNQLKWNGGYGEKVLRTITPYLFTKANEAEIAFRVLAVPCGAAGKGAKEVCYQELRKIKKLGRNNDFSDNPELEDVS